MPLLVDEHQERSGNKSLMVRASVRVRRATKLLREPLIAYAFLPYAQSGHYERNESREQILGTALQLKVFVLIRKMARKRSTSIALPWFVPS